MRFLSIVLASGLLLSASNAYAQAWQSVKDASTIAARTTKFREQLLSKLGSSSKLTDCNHLIRISEGRGPSSWGAFCMISAPSKPHLIMLCNDEWMGYFAIQAGVFTVAEDDLADFVQRNCFGG